MDFDKLQRQLAREAREYLDDLRELRLSLRSVEGWIALTLVLSSALMAFAWAIVSMGFNPASEHVATALRTFGLRFCRPIDNVSGVVMFINLVLMLFLTVISFGNVINMMRRVSQGLPREPRDLIISSSLLLVVGVGGILFMLYIC
jgi:hypothetical protein